VENYFNYFTEIEEQFRKSRAEPVLLSPLDWALIESWKEQDFPLAAVLTGIERSFQKFQTKKPRFRKVNTLAYCAQEVYRAVEEARAGVAQGGNESPAKPEASAPFSEEELGRFFARCAAALDDVMRRAQQDGKPVLAQEVAAGAGSLRNLAAQARAQLAGGLEPIETGLTALEEQLNASLLRGTSLDVLTQLRAEVERGLVPFRRKMPAAEVDLLERRSLKNHLFEHYRIPRLSLFYL